jgi:hypothetical protein
MFPTPFKTPLELEPIVFSGMGRFGVARRIDQLFIFEYENLANNLKW